MTEMKCSSCGAGLSFKSVLTSTNPARIKCTGCGHKAEVPVSYVIPIALAVVVLSIALWYFTEQSGLRHKTTLIAFVALGLGVEFLYFIALKRELIPSTLVKEFKSSEKTNEQRPNTYSVVPRIKNMNFVKTTDHIMSNSEASKPIVEHLAGDLVLAYAIDIGDNYLTLSDNTAKEFNIDVESVQKTAKFNALHSLKNIRMNTHGKIVELACPDGMMACSILFPDLWNQIEGDVGGPVIVAVPHRDTVLYARADDNGAIEELKNAMTHFNFEDTHALSSQFFVRTGDKWRVFEG